MNNILVSIIIPTHNRLVYLQKAINSVLSQTYRNFEIIIVNDGSDDGTEEFLYTLKNKRIKVFHNKVSHGACLSRNIGISIAKGKLITFLDDDDEFLPQRLEEMISAYDFKWAYIASGYYYKNRYKCLKKIPPKIIDTESMSYKIIIGNSILVERNKVLKIGGFDLNLKSSQDYDLWFRLNKAYGDALCVQNALFVMHADYDLERITNSINKASGHFKFYMKHKADFKKKARAAQLFRVICYKRKRMGFRHLICLAGSPVFGEALKYYLSKRFPLIKAVYRKIV